MKTVTGKTPLKINKKTVCQFLVLVGFLAVFSVYAHAEPSITINRDGITIGTADNPAETSATIQVLLLLTVLSLAPSILIMMTSFIRTVIILSFVRNSVGTQQMPPNQILIGLALFLTFFIMSPVLSDLNSNALQPYTKGEITQQEALARSSETIKTFMLNQMKNVGRDKDLAFFASLSGIDSTVKPEELPLTVIIPAFIVNELTVAFKMGFIIYIPFLVIDMVVSSTLMSMGMMMLPPVMISLPFKIMLFVMVDGWSLVVRTIVNSFAR